MPRIIASTALAIMMSAGMSLAASAAGHGGGGHGGGGHGGGGGFGGHASGGGHVAFSSAGAGVGGAGHGYAGGGNWHGGRSGHGGHARRGGWSRLGFAPSDNGDEFDPPYYGDNEVAAARCRTSFRSFDLATGNYIGYDGLAHRCPYM